MTRRRFILPALALLVAALATAPMEAANKEHQQMMADLRMLQQQNQLLQAQLTALTDVLKSVSVRLDEQAGTSRKAFADQKLLVDTLGADLRVVREKVDETNVRLTSLSQEVDAIRTAPAAVAQPAPGTVPTGGVEPPPAAPAAAPTGFGASPSKAFETARNDYFSGNWPLAIDGFEGFIRSFPKSDMADDAQYYIGETHFAAGTFPLAIAAYDKVIATYPASNTLPDVYYKRGLAQQALGQSPQARESLEYVIKTFPTNETIVGLARQALERINRSIKK
jgi:tol-pal system protein YbgF